jgi:FkbH-like protein
VGSVTKEIKCVIWDLDNTLWHGTLLEDEHVELKAGIEHLIQELDKRGILQSIASKNHADHALDKLKAFKLDEYFLYPEINWNSKSSSIKRIAEHLNIGTDTLLFIDDEPYEREEVRSVFPEILCLCADEYREMLSHPRLNPLFLTQDSKRRRLMYLEDLQRKRDEEEYQGPTEKFLASLKMELLISEAREEDLKRAQELSIRTHQLNATGIIYSYDELDSFRTSKAHKLYICELVDKYSSYGKIGLALVEIKEYWHLKLLLMSCRVISRGIGTVLLSFLMKEARKYSRKMYADFRMTDRNRQMYISFKFSGFQEIQSNEEGSMLLEHNLLHIQEYPPFVKLVCATTGEEKEHEDI